MTITVRPLRFVPRILLERSNAVWVTSKPISPNGATALKATKFGQGPDGFVLGAKAVILELIKLGWKQNQAFELFVTALNPEQVKQGYDAIRSWLNDPDVNINGHYLSLSTQSSTAPVGIAFKIGSQTQNEKD